MSLRRTVKHLMDRRQARLIDLGGFTLAMYRQGKISDALLADKAAEVAALEDEILLIERGAVDRRHAREEAARGRGSRSGRSSKTRRSAPEPAPPPAPAEPAPVAPDPVAAAPAPAPTPAPPPPPPRVDGQLDLNAADFDQLRGIGMSITQAKRVLDYRERIGHFSSIDDLDVIPGFPQHFRADLKHQIVV